MNVRLRRALALGALVAIVGACGVQSDDHPRTVASEDVPFNLLASGTKGFVGGLLAGINPFTIWTFVLTALGVSTTQRMAKGNAYAVAAGSFIVVWLIASGLRALNG
jgi:hypothetical protein